MNTKLQTVEREVARRFDNVVAFGPGRRASEFSALLKDYCKEKRFCAKEIIYREGGQAHTTYVVRSGLVKLLSYLPNGRARIVRLHGPGAWFGLGGLLKRPYEHTAVSIGDVEVYCVPVNRLLQLQLRSPRQFIPFLDEFHAHLREADVWISQFSTGAIKPRVARLLVFLSHIEYGEASGLVELLTVHEMADILGVTPESVSRILAEFKRGGILNRLVQEPTNELYRFNIQVLSRMAGH